LFHLLDAGPHARCYTKFTTFTTYSSTTCGGRAVFWPTTYSSVSKPSQSTATTARRRKRPAGDDGRPVRATPVPSSARCARPARCGGHARDERRGTQECGRSDRSAFARAGVCGRSGAELLTSSVVCCNPWGSTTAGQRAFARPGDMRGTSNISWRWDSFVSCTLASGPFAF